MFPITNIGLMTAMPDITNGLIAWFKFTEGTGTTTYDAISGSRYASLLNSAAFITGSTSGYGVTTRPTGTSVLSLSSYIPITTWTLSCWSKFPLVTYNNSWRTLVRGVTLSANHQVIVDLGNNLGMYDNDTGTGFRTSGYSVASLSAGWHFIAAIGSGSITQFYIDSTYVGASDHNSIGSIDYIGNYQGGNQNWGEIDDFRVYNRALTATEIASLYSNGAK